jgi:hypothetical protein
MQAPCASCGAAMIARARTINMADVRMAYVAIQSPRGSLCVSPIPADTWTFRAR